MLNLKEINDEEVSRFVHELLDYYGTIDRNSINVIYEPGEKALRCNAGWYHYKNGKHYICINIPNILALKSACAKGFITIKDFYAFTTICVSHEFRHFLQARYIKDGIPLDGYSEDDILEGEAIAYIKTFFDRYYLLNKGFIKSEEDAEKFAIQNGVKVLKKYYPELEPESSIVNAVNHYAKLQINAGVISTVPLGCKTIDEILLKIEDHINNSRRIPDLNKTLSVENPIHYEIQKYYKLNHDKLFTRELFEKYNSLENASKQDLLVIKKILSSISGPKKSLKYFPELKKKYGK